MKRITPLFLSLLLLCHLKTANAQTWAPAGQSDQNQPSLASSTYMCTAYNSSGVAYCAYEDGNNSNKLTVRKYSGGTWTAVGSAGFSAGGATYICMAFDASGNPYVAYNDAGNSNYCTCMEYNGSSWVTIGSAGFSGVAVHFTCMAIDGSGNIYVNYKNGSTGVGDLMEYSGSSWALVGGASYSAGAAFYNSIVLDGSGNPYVGYYDAANSNRATVREYVSSAWTTIGTAGFTPADALYTSIAFDGSGNLYIAYADNYHSLKASVMEYSGGSWSNVGSAGFSAGANYYNSLFFQGSTPYLAYQDGGHGSTLTVMEYNGSSWVTLGGTANSTYTTTWINIGQDGSGNLLVGYDDGGSARLKTYNGTSWVNTSSGISSNITSYNRMAVNAGGTPYMVYADAANSYKATVVSYNGSTWATVGSAGFSAGTAYFSSIAIDPSGTPYVSFEDGNSSNKITVMKYNGSSWVTVGTAGFSSGAAVYSSMAIDASGTPYVAYRDAYYSAGAVVMKYNGSSWAVVGSANITFGTANYESLAINSKGTLYLAFEDGNNSSKATVMTYNGSSWANVGSAGFSTGYASYCSLQFDHSDNPYLAFTDGGAKASLMKYNGSSWAYVGSSQFSSGNATYVSLAIDANNNPYVGYVDAGNSSKATVMTYNGSSWVNLGSAGFGAATVNYTTMAMFGSTIYMGFAESTYAYAYSCDINTSSVKTWAGASTSWNTAGNWSPSGVPGSSDAVIIPSSLSFYPTLDVNANAEDINIYSGATLTGATGYSLTVTKDITGSGTFSPGVSSVYVGGSLNVSTFTPGTSTVQFNGSAAQYVNGTYNSVSINNSSNVSLGSAATINGTLSFSSGKLMLGNYKLTIGSGGSISGASSSGYIYTTGTGSLEMTTTAGANVFPIGDSYNPITINDAGGGNVFDVSVSDGLTDNHNATVTDWAVNRTWQISTPGGATVTVTPQWDETTDLAGADFDLTDAFVSYRDVTSTYTWTPGSSSDISAQSNPHTLTSGSIIMNAGDVYNIGVSGGSASQLPVTLLIFDAQAANHAVNLSWQTASEINNDYFGIERSLDGQTWQQIGQVPGHGNSQVSESYNYTDNLEGIIPSGDFYYRLKQVDFNGKFTYSMIRAVDISGPAGVGSAYPNPVSNSLNISWLSTSSAPSVIKLQNTSGITVFQENVSGLGQMNKQVDMSRYDKGTYILQITSGNNNLVSQAVIKE